MSQDDRQQEETSPLLGRTTIVNDYNAVSDDIAVNGNEAVLDGQGKSGPQEEQREIQFAGLPEVKKQLKFIVPAIAIGVFLSAADQTIIVSTYGRIGSELNALEKTTWIATGYFFTLAAFQPLYGKLSDIFGRKEALLFAYVVFGLGCLLCGLARNINELIAARVFAGIGGGGMTTVVSILLSDVVSLRERGTWQGYINIIYASGAGIGAPLGGVLADTIGWRWAFLIQAPLCAVAFLSVAFILHLPKKDDIAWTTKLRRIDFLGAFTLVAAVALLQLGLDRGTNYAWTAPITLVSLCLAIPLFGLFTFFEAKVAAEPFAPGRIITDRSLVACYLCNFFSFGSWLATIFYIPLFYQAVDGLNATQAGTRLLPGVAASVTGSLAGGIIMQKTGKYYWITVIAYQFLVPAMIMILVFSGLAINNTYGISVGIALGGFTNGIGITTTLLGLLSNAAPEDQAVVTACSYLFRSLGSIIGLALASTVVQQVLRTELTRELGSGDYGDQLAKQVRESLDVIKTLDPALRDVVRECYGRSVRAGYGLLIGFVILSALSSWFIREKKLSH